MTSKQHAQANSTEPPEPACCKQVEWQCFFQAESSAPRRQRLQPSEIFQTFDDETGQAEPVTCALD